MNKRQRKKRRKQIIKRIEPWLKEYVNRDNLFTWTYYIDKEKSK